MTTSLELGDPGTAAFQVERYPFYLLNRLVSRYNLVIEAGLRTIGINIPTWRVLMLLGEQDERSVGQLAEGAVIPFSTMTRIVQRMAAAGLVGSQTSPDDNRVSTVSLTDTGQATLGAARRITAPIYAQVTRGFTPETFDQLTDSLNRLYDNLAILVPVRRPAKASGAAAASD